MLPHFNLALSALELFRYGVGIVESGRLSFRNHAFDAIVTSGDGVYVTDGMLRASRPSEERRLQAAIEAATLSTAGGAACVTIARPSGRTAYIVHACRLGAALDPSTAAGPLHGVLLLLSDPTQRPVVAAEQLVGLWDLSPSEAAVACHIAAGDTVEQTAAALGISVKTCRRHLGSIFRKTGVDRQTGLVRLLLFSAIASIQRLP